MYTLLIRGLKDDNKVFFMLSWAEHEIYMLIDMKMPMIFGIYIFSGRVSLMLISIVQKKVQVVNI